MVWKLLDPLLVPYGPQVLHLLTWVEGRTSSESLVPLLEGPEHGVEQHLVSGLPRRIQKLPGRHVVMATCSRRYRQEFPSDHAGGGLW